VEVASVTVTVAVEVAPAASVGTERPVKRMSPVDFTRSAER
jgi:hypothetical protein